jgi:hypothetical protein
LDVPGLDPESENDLLDTIKFSKVDASDRRQGDLAQPRGCAQYFDGFVERAFPSARIVRRFPAIEAHHEGEVAGSAHRLDRVYEPPAKGAVGDEGGPRESRQREGKDLLPIRP